MNKIKFLPVLLISTFCLSGCASKVSEEKFIEKAENTTQHRYKGATVKVNYDATSSTGVKQTISGTLHYGWVLSSPDLYGPGYWVLRDSDRQNDQLQAAKTYADAMVGLHVLDAKEIYAYGSSFNADATVNYYAGGLVGPKFKITSVVKNKDTENTSRTTMKFEKYGLLTSLNINVTGNDKTKMNITVSYSRT